MMKLIDTHAHLYLEDFDEDREACFHRAREAGLTDVYLPNIDVDSIDRVLQLEQEAPDFYHAMMGLHPCSVGDDWEDQLEVIENWLERRSFCAVGEIGMDLYWDATYKDQQIMAFRRQANWAKSLDLPIVIHNRDATEDLLELVREEQDGRLSGIFHCFTGTVEEGKAMIDLDFYLGIGGILTFKNSDLEKVISELPLERMVLETDAPYLAPEPKRGNRNESAYLPYINMAIAEAKNLSPEEVAEVTSRNAAKVYRKRERSSAGD